MIMRRGIYKMALKQWFQQDAMKGAIYIGNVNEVLETHLAGEELITQDQIDEAPFNNPNDNNYPKEMESGTRSDWLSNGPYDDLLFMSKKEYPQLGSLNIGLMGYDFSTEETAIFNLPDYNTFQSLTKKITLPSPSIV